MNSFLSIVANDVFEYYNQRLSDVLFILPNRRSGLVFKNELIKQIKTPVWSPEIFSINDWIINLCDLEQAEEYECLINLYIALKKHWSKIGTFVDFLSWGDILLRDFDEIDKYLISYEKLYRQLSDEKEIEERFSMLNHEEFQMISRFWKGLDSKASQTQKDWLSLWNSLSIVSQDYIQQLRSKGKTSVSFMYRSVAEMIDDPDKDFLKKDLCFIGFNALTKSEEKIFEAARNSEKARFYWDAGELIEKYITRFPAPESFSLKLACEPNRLTRPDSCNLPELKLSSYESGLAQVKDIGPRLKNDGSYAVVLGDEEVLDELMWSLNVKQEHVNVSIGRPVYQTKLGQSLSKYFDQLDSADSSSDQDDNEWNVALSQIYKGFVEDLENDSGYFEEKVVEQLNEKITLIRKLGKDYHSDLLNVSWHWILKKWLRSAKIPYPSNPEAKILVTGILETRLLDFENLYILTMNEGVWPARSRNSSFIPYHLRKEFGMPVPETIDGMYGYHFYRLIQRAVNVEIGYVAQSDNLKDGAGEMSRFIKSLLYLYNVPLEIKQVVAPAKVRSLGTISIPKSDELKQLLMKYTKASGENRILSPSALNTYVECGLRFFFQYLLKIKDEDEPEDLFESRLFGKLLHETMERLYTHVLSNKNVTKSDIQSLLDKGDIKNNLVLPVIIENVSGVFASVDHETLGAKDNLVIDVIANYIKLILKTDLDYAPFSIAGLELKVKSSFPVSIEGEEHEVILGGIIDRIDSKGDIVRVVDYKSGSPAMKFQDFESLINGAKSDRAKEIFQALFYSYLLKENQDYKDKKLIPGLYAMRNIQNGLLQPYVTYKKKLIENDDEYVDEMKQILSELLSEIFNPEIEFSSTTNKDNCKYCSFQAYCQKN